MLAVFAFHLGVLPAGWLGVEVFFVLSGFVITMPLLHERTHGTFSFQRFYFRRAARLMPAGVATVVFTTTYSLTADHSVKMHLEAALAALLYYANLVMAAGGEMGLLGHIWSLSLEEQFYFVWPLLLMVSLALGGMRAAGIVAAGGAVASFVARAVLTGDGAWWDRVYYGPDTRAGGLLIGCLAGIAVYNGRLRRMQDCPGWLLWALFVGVASAMVWMDNGSHATWQLWLTVFDCVVAAALVAMYDRMNSLTRLLSARPVTWVGDLSYSIYLWHLPLIAIVGYHVESNGLRMGLQVVLPFVAAAGSFYLLERPLRNWAKRRSAHIGTR